MAKIGRSYPRIEAHPLAGGPQNTAAAYRRFFGPFSSFSEPIFEAAERHKLASGILAFLGVVAFIGAFGRLLS